MGTRNLTMVIDKLGETKVAQYGQWDGHLDGQGLTVLEFLKKANLAIFCEKLSKINWLTEDQIKVVNSSTDWAQEYPYLSRDRGSQILNCIYDGKLTISRYDGFKKDYKFEIIGLTDESSFANDSLMCEYAYVIDLKKNTFEIYTGFNKNPLDKSERFCESKKDGKYYPVKLLKSYPIDCLPSKEEFLNLEEIDAD